jgi:hypothetical protein
MEKAEITDETELRVAKLLKKLKASKFLEY